MQALHRQPQNRNSSALLNIKKRGGLTKPSPAIEIIVRVSETVFSDLIKDGRNLFIEKNLVDKIIIKVNQTVLELFPSLLKDVDDHVETHTSSHRYFLIKKVVSCYIKLILFKNQ